nr:pyridoxamine kinase [Liquorilactobacillus capillatus]
MVKNILVAQDLSCAGQVSMSVALPLLGAAGLRPTILPTALLSTHTGGLGTNTYLDLSNELKKIINHWHSLDLKFSGVYFGYLGQQPLTIISQYFDMLVTPQSFVLIDPVMGDHGRLYRGFNNNYTAGMRQLVSKARIITPNITEAAFLLGKKPTTTAISLFEAEQLLQELKETFDIEQIVLTGVHLLNNKIAVLSYDKISQEIWSRQVPKIPGSYFGTGDLFASVLFIMLVQKIDLKTAISKAMDFVSHSIHSTLNMVDFNPHYGVDYAAQLPQLLKDLAHMPRRA